MVQIEVHPERIQLWLLFRRHAGKDLFQDIHKVIQTFHKIASYVFTHHGIVVGGAEDQITGFLTKDPSVRRSHASEGRSTPTAVRIGGDLPFYTLKTSRRIPVADENGSRRRPKFISSCRW